MSIDLEKLEALAKAVDRFGPVATAGEVLALIAEVRALRKALNTPLLTGADDPMYGGIFCAEGVNRDAAMSAFYSGAPVVTVYYGRKHVFASMAEFCAAHPKEPK